MAMNSNKRVDTATIKVCLAAVVVIYILIIIGVCFTQASTIFHTGGLTTRPPEALPIDQVTFATADGLGLNGWWLAADAPAARCFISRVTVDRPLNIVGGSKRIPGWGLARLSSIIGLRPESRAHTGRGIYRSGRPISAGSKQDLTGHPAKPVN